MGEHIYDPRTHVCVVCHHIAREVAENPRFGDCRRAPTDRSERARLLMVATAAEGAVWGPLPLPKKQKRAGRRK